MQNFSFGDWLAAKRGGIPASVFAEDLGIDTRTFTRAESPHADVLVPTAVRISRGLGLTFEAFFQDWQGACPSAHAAQLAEDAYQGVLTREDVARWLLRVLEGHSRNREMLLAALNLIALRSGLLSKPLPPMVKLFGLADIEKMLWNLSWFRYEVTPPLHEAVISDLPFVYQQRGLVLREELGAYIRLLRLRQGGVSLKQFSEETQIPIATLTSIENGMIKHLKLCDLLALDDFLGCGGSLAAFYWWEVTNRLELEEAWSAEPVAAEYASRVKHDLTSLMISVGRWLQVIYQEETIWLDTLRYELGLYQLGAGDRGGRG